MTNKVEIINQDRFRQATLFDKIALQGDKRCTGTDIDFCMDIKKKALLFAELKAGSWGVPTGQKILMQTIVKNCTIPCYYVVASHSTNPKDDIVAADSTVRTVYTNNGKTGAFVEVKLEGETSLLEFIYKIEKKYLGTSE